MASTLFPQAPRLELQPASEHRSDQRQSTLRLSAAGPARNPGIKKSLLSRLANRLQIPYQAQPDPILLPAEPLAHRKRAPRAAQHSAQNFRNNVDNLAATPAV